MIKSARFLSLLLSLIAAFDAALVSGQVMLGQGVMSGEVTHSSVLLQTRLTETDKLTADGDIPGANGAACFQWSLSSTFADAQRTELQTAVPERDFIVRSKLTGLTPHTKYYYQVLYGVDHQSLSAGPTGTFQTLPGPESKQPVRFAVGSCMNYIKFMHGRAGNSDGPLTATAEDKRLGFPAFESLRKIKPDFFVGTGDIVYYDNPFRPAETVAELRKCWHEQFRFPRMIAFFRDVPTIWSKDDHDFRFDDADNTENRLPLPSTGIDVFREQLPIASFDQPGHLTYRTFRVNRDLQIWLTEGRDYRSPNTMADAAGKTLWGTQQRKWLQETLKASDARWKILITPTPMVGPDDDHKRDNHANLGGFRHEANDFFRWLREENISGFMTICGDRHWQYHSIHPLGVQEFSCGALNDENARLGVKPGSPKGTDVDAEIRQPYTSPQPSGGFLLVSVAKKLTLQFLDDQGNQLYHVKF